MDPFWGFMLFVLILSSVIQMCRSAWESKLLKDNPDAWSALKAEERAKKEAKDRRLGKVAAFGVGTAIKMLLKK